MAVSTDIQQKADDIRTKVYGKDVRESLASGLETMSSDINQFELDMNTDNENFKTDITIEEQQHTDAENARVTAENTRETNETIRQNNEQTRQTNETTRVNNETTRQSDWEQMQHIDANAELVAARQGATTLLANLQDKDNKIGNLTSLNTTAKDSAVNAINEVNSQLAEKANETDNSRTTIAKTVTGAINELNSNKADQTALNTTNNNVALKADKSYVDTQVQAVASGSPKGTYATVSALQTAYPSGNSNTYVVTADGGWYYWNGSAWTKGGTYQSTGIADNSITPNMMSTTVIAPDNTKAISNLPSTDVKSNLGTLYTSSTLVGSMAINLNKAGDSTQFNVISIPFQNDTNANIAYAYCIIRNYNKVITETHFKQYIGAGNYVFELNQTHIPGENMYIQAGVCDINLNNIQSFALPLSITSVDPLITLPCWYQADGTAIISGLLQANGSWYGFNYELKYIANTSKIYKLDDTQYAKKTDITKYDPLLTNSSKTQFLMPVNIYLNDNVNLWAYWNNIIHLFDCYSKIVQCPYASASDLTAYAYNNDKLIVTGGKSTTLNLQLLDYTYSTVWNSPPVTIVNQNITVTGKTHSTGKTINTLVIGDSYMAVQWGSGALQYMKDFATADGNTINFKGTKNNYGDGSLLSESIGGWTEAQFHTSSSSPFVFSGSFDFAQYLSSNNISGIDNIVFFLGMNGGNGDDINAMITNIKSALPNVKIFVCMVPSAALNPMVTSNWYSQVMQTQRTRNIQNLYYLQKFDNRQGENIYLIPTHAVMDRIAGIRSATYNKYQFSDCDNTQENLANDHHPTPLGAKAISNIIYNYLSYFTA